MGGWTGWFQGHSIVEEVLVSLRQTAGLGGATVMATTEVGAVAGAVAADERDVRRVQRWTDRLGILHAHPTLNAVGAGRVVDRQQPAPLRRQLIDLRRDARLLLPQPAEPRPGRLVELVHERPLHLDAADLVQQPLRLLAHALAPERSGGRDAWRGGARHRLRAQVRLSDGLLLLRPLALLAPLAFFALGRPRLPRLHRRRGRLPA